MKFETINKENIIGGNNLPQILFITSYPLWECGL